MKHFDIHEHVAFNDKGRAQCPSCLIDGKTGLNLSVLKTGAYKCFRGCTPQAIREAIGAPKDKSLPPPSPATASTPPKTVLATPQQIKQAHESLLKNQTALNWLLDRGFELTQIRRFKLGLTRTKVGDTSKPNGFAHLPSITIPIPTEDGTAYFKKKRVAPWLEKGDRPDGYQAWNQYGIPAMVFTTHQPEHPKQTWLCEGEWDAMMLAWYVGNCHLASEIQVSCFTCGAGNIPPDIELEKLKGQVITFYDLDDPGQKGAAKLQERLKERCAIAQVPTNGEAPKGWDISDAINAKLWPEIVAAANNAKQWEEIKAPNPLRDRLVSNDELLERAADYTDWLVDDILTSDELFLLAASPRAGKSLLAFTLAQAVASGGKFLGRPVAKGAVIYIRCEDSETKAKERELKQGWGEGLPVYWLDKFKLTELKYLEELIEELGARLVVFDTLSRIRDASISESSAEMSQLLEPVQEMCKRQRCTGLLVHHTGKISPQNAGDIDVFDTIRGSSSIRATCRGTLVLAAGENCYRLAVENGWGKLDLQVLLDANTLQWKLVGNWAGPNVDLSQKDRVLNFLNQVGSASIEAIAEATNLPKRSLYEVLKRLQCDDLVEKRGDRRSAIYVRSSIQQIQQLNSLLNSPNADTEKDVTPIQQISTCVENSEKVINSQESDQNFDHFSDSTAPPTPGNLLTNQLEAATGKDFGIQHEFNSNSTTNSTPDQQLPIGAPVEIRKSGMFYGKHATVKGFEDDLVIVSHPDWYVDHRYSTDELRRISDVC